VYSHFLWLWGLPFGDQHFECGPQPRCHLCRAALLRTGTHLETGENQNRWEVDVPLKMVSIADWWFGTWLSCFHSVGNVIIPTDELIFFRGVGIPPTSIGIDHYWSIGKRETRNVFAAQLNNCTATTKKPIQVDAADIADICQEPDPASVPQSVRQGAEAREHEETWGTWESENQHVTRYPHSSNLQSSSNLLLLYFLFVLRSNISVQKVRSFLGPRSEGQSLRYWTYCDIPSGKLT